MSKSRSALRLLIPGATVFVTSGCAMILVLVASRLVARALGSSLYTWTFTLTVVLTGAALGSFVGGRMADRFHTRRALSVLFALSSAACVALVAVNNVIVDWAWLWRLSWPAHVMVHIGLVFLLPSALLGAVGPVLLRMALDQGLAPGRTVGIILACAAAGSIAGTLLTGFVLIAGFGSTVVVWALGAALLALAFLYWVSCWALYLWAMIFAALAAMGTAPADWARDAGLAARLREPNDPSLIYQDETRYAHVSVHRIRAKPDTRVFRQDQRARGRIMLGDATNVQSFHTEVCAALAHSLGEGERPLSALVVSGGGYVIPQYLQATRPDCRVEVVEIDPGVTRAAHEAFGLPRGTTIRTVSSDARYCVSRRARSELSVQPGGDYDFVYVDATGDCSVPFEWVTRQFNEKVAALLTAGGRYVLGLSDVYESGRLLGAVVNTLTQTFPHVWVIRGAAASLVLPETYVVIATRRQFDPASLLHEHNEHLVFSVLDEAEMAELKARGGGIVLTDDYAPAEQLLAPAVRCAARPRWARRSFQEAVELQRRGRYGRSIARYRLAAELDPSLGMEVYNAIGLIRLGEDDLESAVQAFTEALAHHVETGLQQAENASVHVNLATILLRMGQQNEARTHLAEAARRFRVELERHPKSVHLWESLADALVLAGHLREATEAFEQAVVLDPGKLVYYEKLGKVLEVQRRYDEAIAVARRRLALLKQQGRRDAVLELTQYIDLLEYQKVKQ